MRAIDELMNGIARQLPSIVMAVPLLFALGCDLGLFRNKPAVEYVDPETDPQLKPMTEEEFRQFLEDVRRHNVSPIPTATTSVAS